MSNPNWTDVAEAFHNFQTRMTRHHALAIKSPEDWKVKRNEAKAHLQFTIEQLGVSTIDWSDPA